MLDSTFELPGWATAVDPRTGRQYYINLSEKTTTWDDPRKFNKSVHIPMQPIHGSPKKIQIYPTQQNYPVQAFQNSGHNLSVSASPVQSHRTTSHYSQSHTVEMSSLSRSSPHTSRVGSSLAKSHMQETSFTTSPTPMETEATVARVNQMFPTANENHIRMLLKKYLKSMYPKADDTIILDVLANTENNIQKATAKLIEMGYEKKEMTPAPHLAFTSRKKDHQTPSLLIQPTPPPKPKTADEKRKLKTKLMSQFKAIPEKIITMALESVDFSEEKALRILDIVVQEDKDQKTKKKVDDDKNAASSLSGLKNSRSIDLDSAAAIENDETMIINSDHSIITTPVSTPMTDRTVVDSSSSHDEGKTMHLLQVESDETPTSDASSCEQPVIGEKGKRHRTKARSDSNRSEKTKVTKKQDNKENKVVKKVMFEDFSYDTSEMPSSPVITSVAMGPNPSMSRGPRDELLLTDYVAWSGANPDILLSSKAKALGPNASNRVGSYTARGHNSDLCKGPQRGLAKGSIYSQLSRNVACN